MTSARPDSEPLTLPVQLEVDRRVVRETQRVRGVAALITIVGSAWLAFTQNHWSLALLGVVAGLFAVLWLWRGLREQARALQARHDVLLDHTGITLRQGDHTTHVEWSDVATTRVDEDRLVVMVHAHTGTPLMLEPIFGRLGVYDLHALITQAQHQARPEPLDATPNERG